MKRTTIYLTEAQKAELEAIAGTTGRTEAQLIREGVDRIIGDHLQKARRPVPLFALDDPLLDDPRRVEEALDGFGE